MFIIFKTKTDYESLQYKYNKLLKDHTEAINTLRKLKTMLGLQHTNIEHTLKELEGKIKLESETYDTTMKELNAILQKVVPEDSTFQERNYV